MALVSIYRQVREAQGGKAPPRCGASGWRLRGACTDGKGDLVCPLCGRHVRTHPDTAVGHAVRVVKEHNT